jgi:hypothetical protein
MSGGRVLSVEVGPDEDVEWIWSHDHERGSHVTGYKIVARLPEREKTSPLADINAAWDAEIAQRAAAFERGDLTTHLAEDVLAEARRLIR